MAQIIQNPYAEIGKNLGTGLAALAEQKLGELNKRNQASGLQALLNQTGKQITPADAQALSQLDPRLLQEYIKGQVNPKSPLVSNTINSQEKKPLTVAQEKHRDMVKSSYQVNKELYDTTNRMLESIKTGKVKFGKKNALLSQYLPSQLPNEETGIFAKDAANVFTWTTEAQKGLQSKFRLQTTQKGKPNLEELEGVNVHNLEQINKRAAHNLKNFEKDYPGFNLEDADNYDYDNKHPNYPEEPGEEGEEATVDISAPTDKSDGWEYVEPDGSRYMSKNGRWEPR